MTMRDRLARMERMMVNDEKPDFDMAVRAEQFERENSAYWDALKAKCRDPKRLFVIPPCPDAPAGYSEWREQTIHGTHEPLDHARIIARPAWPPPMITVS